MAEENPIKMRTLYEVPGEHYSNGGGSHPTKILIDERRHPYCCAFPMKRLTPFTFLCGSCGTVVTEQFFGNGAPEFHVSNIGKPLFTMKVEQTPLDVNVNLEHNVQLREPRTRKKTWLERQGNKTVQVEEKETIEDDLHGSSEVEDRESGS